MNYARPRNIRGLAVVGDAPLARLRLWPHRSLTAEGFVGLHRHHRRRSCRAADRGARHAGALGPAALRWRRVALVWIALRRNLRDRTVTEVLTMWPDRVAAGAPQPGAARRRNWQANPHWVERPPAPEGRPGRELRHAEGRRPRGRDRRLPVHRRAAGAARGTRPRAGGPEPSLSRPTEQRAARGTAAAFSMTRCEPRAGGPADKARSVERRPTRPDRPRTRHAVQSGGAPDGASLHWRRGGAGRNWAARWQRAGNPEPSLSRPTEQRAAFSMTRCETRAPGLCGQRSIG